MLALLLVVGCAQGPDWERDPVPPAAWGGDRPPVVCLSSDVTESDLDFSARVWGALEDCDDPEAIPVTVEPLEDALGRAWQDPQGCALMAPRLDVRCPGYGVLGRWYRY